jgi:hypothetical protein
MLLTELCPAPDDIPRLLLSRIHHRYGIRIRYSRNQSHADRLMWHSVAKTHRDHGRFNCQIVPDNRPESDSSHGFADYSQQVPDRTTVYRCGHFH